MSAPTATIANPQIIDTFHASVLRASKPGDGPGRCQVMDSPDDGVSGASRWFGWFEQPLGVHASDKSHERWVDAVSEEPLHVF